MRGQRSEGVAWFLNTRLNSPMPKTKANAKGLYDVPCTLMVNALHPETHGVILRLPYEFQCCGLVRGGFDKLNHLLSLSMVAELVEATALLAKLPKRATK